MKVLKVFFLLLISCNIYGQDVISKSGNFLYYEIVEVKGISNPNSIVSSVFLIDSAMNGFINDSLISILDNNIGSVRLFVELSNYFEVIYFGSLLKRFEGCLRYDVGNKVFADKVKMIVEKNASIESIGLKDFLYKRNFYFKTKTQNVYYYIKILLFSGLIYYVESKQLTQCLSLDAFRYNYVDSTLEILRCVSKEKYGFLIGIDLK